MRKPKQTEFDFHYDEPRRNPPMVLDYSNMKPVFTLPEEGRASLIEALKGPLKILSPEEVKQREQAFKDIEKKPEGTKPILSTDSAERKNTPIWSGWIQYFPLAHAAAARHSKRMNDKHNPGEPVHWAREKSTDHEDCAQRHLIDVNHFNEETQEYEEACSLFWRAGAILQLLEEKRLGRTK